MKIKSILMVCLLSSILLMCGCVEKKEIDYNNIPVYEDIDTSVKNEIPEPEPIQVSYITLLSDDGKIINEYVANGEVVKKDNYIKFMTAQGVNVEWVGKYMVSDQMLSMTQKPDYVVIENN